MKSTHNQQKKQYSTSQISQLGCLHNYDQKIRSEDILLTVYQNYCTQISGRQEQSFQLIGLTSVIKVLKQLFEEL